MSNLRDELQRLSNDAKETGKEIIVDDVLYVAKKFGGSIKLFKKANSDFNCFGYALGLKRYKGMYPDSDFVHEILLNDDILKIDINGLIIIYRNNGNIGHAGIIEGDQVISKWGLGCVWKHNKLDVPSGYGEPVERYAIMDFDDMKRKFHSYCERNVNTEISKSVGSMENWYKPNNHL